MSQSTGGATPNEKEPGSGAKAAPAPAATGGDGGPAKKGAAPAGSPGPRKPGFVRRWTRRIYLAIPVAVLLVIALRVSLIWLLPPAINKTAGQFGLQCRYDKLDLALLGGDFGIWHVKLTPIGSDVPLASADYCRLDISTLDLLRGRIHVRRLEADGADVEVTREADGSIPLLTRFGGAGAPAPAAPAPATQPAQTFNLAPPLAIDGIRVSHVQAHLSDKSVSPAMTADLNLDFWLDDLGSATRPIQWGADVRLWPLVDVVHVEGHGTTSATALAATMTATVRGIHPQQAAAYLRALGIEPVALAMAASMQATLNAQVIPPGPGGTAGLKGSLGLSSLELSADGKPAASAGDLNIAVDSFSAGKLVVSKVSIDKCRMVATHTSKGTIVAAGVEVGGAPPTPTAPVSRAATPGTAAAASATAGGSNSIELRELDLHDIQAALHDDAANPAADLAVGVNDFAVKNVVIGSGGGTGAIAFGGTVSCPGVATSAVIDGSASPWGDQKSATFKLDAMGVNPTALATYLRPLGIESQLKSGEFTLGGQLTLNRTSDGGLSGGATISPLAFTDGQELLAFDSVALTGLTVNAGLNRIGISQVKVAGPRVQVVHEAGGAWRGMGFRFNPAAMAQGGSPASEAAAPVGAGKPTVATGANAAPMALPRIQIDQLTWGAVKFALRDEAQTPAATVTISDAGLELTGLVLDTTATATVPAAKVHGWVSVDGIAKRLEMAGSVTASMNHPAADVQVDGTGLNLAALGPYLKGTGIEPLVKQGELHLHAGADVLMNDVKAGGPVVTATVAKVSFADGADQLAALENLKVDGLSIGDATNGIHVAGFDASGAFGTASREADGALVLSGIRLKIAPSTMPASTMPAPATAPVAAADGASAARGPWRALPPLPLLSVGRVNVADAKVKWSDRADGKSIDTAVTVSAQSDAIVVGKDGSPSAFKVQLKVDGAVDLLTIDGKATLGKYAQSLDVEITGSGLRAGPLAGYVPAGMKVDLADGRLHAKVGASLSPNPAGGMAASVSATDVDYRDGDAAEPLLKVASARAAIGRIDPVGNVIDVDEISSDGVESRVQIAGGVTRAMGVSIGGGDASAGASAVAGASATTQPADPAGSDPAVAPEAMPLFDLRHSPPLVTLAKLDLRLSNFSITDGDLAGAPIVVSGMRLWTDGKSTLLSPHPETLEPTLIKFTTAVDPLVKEISVDTTASLFLPEPAVKVDVTASGISGRGFEQVMPKLKDQIDGSELVDGRFHTHVEASAKVSRRGAFDIDFTRTIQAQINVQPVEFRDGPGGPVLAGVDQIEVGNASVNPRTGDVTVGTLDITKPAARVWKDKAGTHVLNLVIKDQTGAETTAPATTPSAAAHEEEAAPSATTAATTAPSTAAAGPEIRIEKLTVSGLDFEYRDTSVDPPMIIPLTDLSLNVQNLSNRMMAQSALTTFSLDVRSGKVELPKRQEGGSLIFSAVGGLASAIGNIGNNNAASTQPVMEQRDFFDDITADGAISMSPQPKGNVRAYIGAVEMGEFKGFAASKGITVEGGLFDGRFNFVLPGDATMSSQSKIVMTNAQMSEPPHGPIQSLFLLKLPLDVTIATIQDANGELTIPLNFTTSTNSLSGGAITSVVVQTVGQSVATAAASAPQKIVQQALPFNLSDLLKKAKEMPIGIDFGPADATLDAASQAKLADLEKRLKGGETMSLRLHGDLGGGDAVTILKRINLDPAQSIALAAQLRQKKVQLTAQRQVAAESARAELATGSAGQASATVRQLAALDRELGQTEDALDSLYDLLRPGAQQIVARRVRQACVDLAAARLEAIRSALVTAGGPKADAMIHVDTAQFSQPSGDGGGHVTIVFEPVK